MEIFIFLVIVVLLYFFMKSKQPNGISGPSTSFARQFQINYDKDVVAPLRLLKAKFSDQDYRENYDRIISEFSIGFVHGFLALATMQNVDEIDDYEKVMERIFPFTDAILTQVFSDKECADLREILNQNLTGSELWQEGFEWGWRDCESWQETGAVTLIWLDYVGKQRDGVFNIPDESKIDPSFRE